jgi:hypothetical protein
MIGLFERDKRIPRRLDNPHQTYFDLSHKHLPYSQCPTTVLLLASLLSELAPIGLECSLMECGHDMSICGSNYTFDNLWMVDLVYAHAIKATRSVETNEVFHR